MTVKTLATDELGPTLRNAVQDLAMAPEGSTTVTFTSDTRLLRNLLTEARIRQFSLLVDEPTSLGGSDEGPNPVELVLAALGTCQEIVYAAYAAVLDIELEELEITASGLLDPRGFFGVAQVPAGFQKIELRTSIRSREEPEKIRALVETVQAHCPVLDIVQRPLDVENRIELNGVPLNSGQ